MKREIYIPEHIKKYMKHSDYLIDDVGCSDSRVIIFGNMVLKIEKQNDESDNEHKMMLWLQGKLPVPKIYESYNENGVNYLLMSKMNGEMVCNPENKNKPEEMVKLLAEGLKKLWSVNISDCPYLNNIDNKLQLAKSRIDNNLIDMLNVEPETFGPNGFASPNELYEYLSNNKPHEEMAFSHGDYCLPNIFVQNNKISGFVDLGRSGVADKWQDIALCIRSMKQNFSSDNYKQKLLEELNIPCNEEKIEYYILLDELF